MFPTLAGHETKTASNATNTVLYRCMAADRRPDLFQAIYHPRLQSICILHITDRTSLAVLSVLQPPSLDIRERWTIVDTVPHGDWTHCAGQTWTVRVREAVTAMIGPESSNSESAPHSRRSVFVCWWAKFMCKERAHLHEWKEILFLNIIYHGHHLPLTTYTRFHYIVT